MHSRSWYHPDRRTHILSLSLCIFACGQRMRTFSVEITVPTVGTLYVLYYMWYMWRDLFLFLLLLLLLLIRRITCYVQMIGANVRLLFCELTGFGFMADLSPLQVLLVCQWRWAAASPKWRSTSTQVRLGTWVQLHLHTLTVAVSNCICFSRRHSLRVFFGLIMVFLL